MGQANDALACRARAGAWIENMVQTIGSGAWPVAPPARARGLKPAKWDEATKGIMSRPRGLRGLKLRDPGSPLSEAASRPRGARGLIH
jgi:hypothetical protein